MTESFREFFATRHPDCEGAKTRRPPRLDAWFAKPNEEVAVSLVRLANAIADYLDELRDERGAGP